MQRVQTQHHLSHTEWGGAPHRKLGELIGTNQHNQSNPFRDSLTCQMRPRILNMFFKKLATSH